MMLSLPLGLLALASAAAPAVAPQPHGSLPEIVFVSRQRPGGAARTAIPGLGPHARSAAPGGRLLVRDRQGRVRPLLPEGAFWDVADPSVSWNGRRVAFSATVHPDSAWRIWVSGADGRGLAAVTHRDTALAGARYDDIDPCWLPDGSLCFASTRLPQVAEFAPVPVTNLFVVDLLPGATPARITSERNGADEPSVDPRTGRIVYGRWLFNRFLPSDVEPTGVTTDPARALAQEPINVWQALSVALDGGGARLAGGDPRERAGAMAYQPILLDDGSLVGVRAAVLPLSPESGSTGIQISSGFRPPLSLAGFGSRLGASACAPAALPDGRILFSCDPDGAGDFGLFVMRRDGTEVARVVDLPGTLELDGAVLAPRRHPPILRGACQVVPPDAPLSREEQLHDGIHTFRFDCLNVFATGPVDSPFPDAPALARGARIRFFAALSRPKAAGGDTLVLVRESSLDAGGAVHEHDMPADTPLFEQLVDGEGRVLRTRQGAAAHVPGFNFARLGSGTKCVGCHAGHSALEVPINYERATLINVSPSAEVETSSQALGMPGGSALVDRRARGPVDQVAWVAGSATGQSATLRWKFPVEVHGVVLYAVASISSEGTNVRVRETELLFTLDGHEVKRVSLRRDLDPSGTRLECGAVRADAMQVRLARVTGTVRHRSAAALAEIETLARLPED